MTIQSITPVLVKPTLVNAFDEGSLAFCYALSESIFADPHSRQFADLAALAFWLRKANIQRMITSYRQDDYIYKPIGLVFHSAPANVDSLFIYSGILSLLMGNKNIIRLSNRAAGSAAVLIEKLTMLATDYPEQVARLQLIQCEHNSTELNAINAIANARVLWGSDSAIRALRTYDTLAHCRDLIFSHKLSAVLLDADAVVEADDSSFNSLLDKFCRDNLTFSQQACSSAKVVIWLGDEHVIELAQQRFWPALSLKALSIREPLTDAEHFDALARAQQLLIQDTSTKNLIIDSPIVRVTVKHLTAEQVEIHTGSGLFLELSVSKLEQLDMMLMSYHQTLSWWGGNEERLRNWYQDLLCGIDRLVPVGEALQFDHVWDGQDLILALSRVARV